MIRLLSSAARQRTFSSMTRSCWILVRRHTIRSYLMLQSNNIITTATFLWQKVAEPAERPIAKRAGHSATVANNLMIVTGGVNSESDQICLTEISVLDLGKLNISAIIVELTTNRKTCMEFGCGSQDQDTLPSPLAQFARHYACHSWSQ